MGAHDDYGKKLLSRVLGSRFDSWASSRNVKLAGIEIRLDGVITSPDSSEVEYAVEIEAENEPQVRGAILNLFLHPAPKALLLLMTRNLYNPLPEALAHFQAVWNQLTGGNRGTLPIICLMGDGKEPAWEEDETRLRIELPKFGIK